jgi:hypothetical protein
VLPHRWQGSSWEPSWEPFAMDHDGRPWTPMESKALSKRPNALLWTLMHAAWQSKDQEVGCSSRPGRADEIPCSSRGFDVLRCSLKGPSRATFGSHSPDRTSPGDITLATDTHNSAPGWPWWQLTGLPGPDSGPG